MSDRDTGRRILGSGVPYLTSLRRCSNGETVFSVSKQNEADDSPGGLDDYRYVHPVRPEDAPKRSPSGWAADEILADVKRLRTEWTTPENCSIYMPAEEIDRLVSMLLERGIGKPASAAMEYDPVKWMAGILGADAIPFKREQFERFHASLLAIDEAVLQAIIEKQPTISEGEEEAPSAATEEIDQDTPPPVPLDSREAAIEKARGPLSGRLLIIFNVLASTKHWVYFDTLRQTRGAFNNSGVTDRAVEKQLTSLRDALAESPLKIDISGLKTDAPVRAKLEI